MEDVHNTTIRKRDSIISVNGSSVTSDEVISMIRSQKRSRKASHFKFQRVLAHVADVKSIGTFVSTKNGVLETIPGVKVRKDGFTFQELHDLTHLELHLWADEKCFRITPLLPKKIEDSLSIEHVFVRQVCVSVIFGSN